MSEEETPTLGRLAAAAGGPGSTVTPDESFAAVAALCHKLRTPLNSIVGWTHMLKTGVADAEKVARAVEVIHRNAMAQDQLISDILDVARVITDRLHLEMEPVALPEVVGAVVEESRPAAETRGVSFVTDIEKGPTIVSGDPSRLAQVARNLVTNAIKHSARGGVVSVRLAREGTEARLTVTDSGAGLTEDMLPVMFDLFRPRKEGPGTPQLGLALVRELVERHGGTVAASSPGTGEGATFTVTLPLVR